MTVLTFDVRVKKQRQRLRLWGQGGRLMGNFESLEQRNKVDARNGNVRMVFLQ